MKDLWKGNVRGIEWEMVVYFAVDVGVLSRKNDGPGRCTNGIGDTGVGEEHAHFGDAVNVGRFDQAVVITQKSPGKRDHQT